MVFGNVGTKCQCIDWVVLLCVCVVATIAFVVCVFLFWCSLFQFFVSCCTCCWLLLCGFDVLLFSVLWRCLLAWPFAFVFVCVPLFLIVKCLWCVTIVLWICQVDLCCCVCLDWCDAVISTVVLYVCS